MKSRVPTNSDDFRGGAGAPTRRATAWHALAVALSLIVPACGGTDGEAGGGAATGLDGPDHMLAPVVEDVYTVGAMDGEDWETFGTIASVAFDSRGHLHVLDEGAKRVVVVDGEGRLVRTVGKDGDGPGEFRSPTAFALLSGDRLAVLDFGMPLGFEVFDAEGAYVRTARLDMTKGVVPSQRLLPLPGDRVLSVGRSRIRFSMAGAGGDAGEPEVADNRRPVNLFSLDGEPHRLVYQAWSLPPTETAFTENVEHDRTQHAISVHFQRFRAFTPGLHVAVLSDGRFALVDSVGYRVKLLTTDGGVDAVLERPIEPVAVTRAIEDAYRARRLADMEADGINTRISVSGSPLPDMSAMFKRQIEEMAFAAEIPVIAGLGVDREDRVWVTRRPPEGFGDGLVDILTPGGEYLGTIPADGPRIPAAFGPDGLMAYIETDDLDMQSVRVARLVSLGRLVSPEG